MNNETNTELIPLSTLLHTDCYIHCGSNERLREVVKVLTIPADDYCTVFGIYNDDVYISILNKEYLTLPENTPYLTTHHINQINLDK
jgi:hypothetical protein